MSLIILGDTLRVGNTPIEAQVFSTTSSTYTEFVSITGAPSFDLSTDKKTVIFHPSTNHEGAVPVIAHTSQGTIEIPLWYLSKYEKDTTLINATENYYPENMFVWDSDNPKWDEVKSNTDLFRSLLPTGNLVPLLDHLVPHFSDYCSSQLIGIAIQLALQEYAVGNTNTLVVYTDILDNPTSISSLIGQAPATLTDTNSTMFVSAAATARETGETPPLPLHIGLRVVDEPIPTVPADNPEYGNHFVLYDSSFSPRRYHDITSSENELLCLKYGAVKRTYDQLEYTKFQKVVYVGQNKVTADTYFAFDGGTDGAGFADDTFPPNDPSIGGIWWDGGRPDVELTTWQDIEGMPVSNEVIYNKENIDVSNLTQEVIIPSYSRMVMKEVDFIPWLSKFEPNIQRLSIRFDGKDFIIKLTPDNVYFAFAGKVPPSEGFDKSIWR